MLHLLPLAILAHGVNPSEIGGRTARGRVVYLQPKAERRREQADDVHIVCLEWLEPDWYPAIYLTGERSFRGQYMPQVYEMGNTGGYLFRGIFEQT
jgi:hypothetical protein